MTLNVKSWFKSWVTSFTFQAYILPHTLNLIFVGLFKSYLNFKAVLALPKTARSAQTHKSISFIWIVWSTLYVYLWLGIASVHMCSFLETLAIDSFKQRIRIVNLVGCIHQNYIFLAITVWKLLKWSNFYSAAPSSSQHWHHNEHSRRGRRTLSC